MRRFIVMVAISLAAVGLEASTAPAAAGPRDGTLTFSDVFLTPGIYTADADASARNRVLDVSGVYRPKWFPDGSRISFLAETKHVTRLEVMRPDGSNRHILVSGPELPAGYKRIVTYDWSPDASRVALCLLSDDFTTEQSYVADANGSNLVLLSDNACVYDWSAQDRILAGRHRRVFVLMDPDGSNRARVEPGMQVGDPEISPAGTEIVFQCGKFSHMDICTIGVDGSRLFHVTTSQRIDWSPSWSPDGTRIIWGPTTDPKYQSADLMRIRPDGTHNVRLTDTPQIDEYEPDWTA
jgi:Tol biopolymer transport system component